MLAVLVDGGGADHLDLTARQRRLEDGSGVDRALGRTGPDERVHLVDEQDDVARIHNLFDAFFQALLELAAILGARNERTHIKCEQTFASQDVRHLVRYDELRQALDDGGLAHARLADKQRIVLLAAGEHLHDPLDLACTADDRVELAVARLLCEIGAELLEHAVRRPSVRVERVAAGVHRALPHQVVERRAHIVARDAQAREHLERRSVALAHDAQQQMLGGYVGLAHLHGLAQLFSSTRFTRGVKERCPDTSVSSSMVTT